MAGDALVKDRNGIGTSEHSLRSENVIIGIFPTAGRLKRFSGGNHGIVVALGLACNLIIVHAPRLLRNLP